MEKKLNIKITKNTHRPIIEAALFDLDGTLLNTKEEIPSSIQTKIKEISKIIPVSIISGRIFSSVLDYSKQLNLISPQISDNGSIIFDPKLDNKIIFRKSLDIEISSRIFRLLDKNNFDYFSSADGKTMDNKMKNKSFSNVNIITCFYEDVRPYLKSSDFIDISKISLIHSSGSMGEEYISFMPKDVNKGVALKEYSRLLGIDQPKIFAIGDGMNDLEMLQEAGISVAMGNSVKEVFDVSKYTTNKYEDDGTEIVLDWIIRCIS